MRSNCPISYALDFFGDKWTLLIIRDMVFDHKRFYKEFKNSGEGIATNILSDRLKKLEASGVVESSVYEQQKTQKVYRLTAKGKDLIPILVDMIAWSGKHKDDLNVEQEFLRKVEANRELVIKTIRERIE